MTILERISVFNVVNKLYYCNSEIQMFYMIDKDEEVLRELESGYYTSELCARLIAEIDTISRETLLNMFRLDFEMVIIVATYIIYKKSPGLLKTSDPAIWRRLKHVAIWSCLFAAFVSKKPADLSKSKDIYANPIKRFITSGNSETKNTAKLDSPIIELPNESSRDHPSTIVINTNMEE